MGVRGESAGAPRRRCGVDTLLRLRRAARQHACLPWFSAPEIDQDGLLHYRRGKDDQEGRVCRSGGDTDERAACFFLLFRPRFAARLSRAAAPPATLCTSLTPRRERRCIMHHIRTRCAPSTLTVGPHGRRAAGRDRFARLNVFQDRLVHASEVAVPLLQHGLQAVG